MNRKKTAFVFLLYIGCVSIQTHAQLLTHDFLNWIASIDLLYSTYDQIQHNIEVVRNTYEQLKQAYEQAKTWKLDDIQWDGNFDFRNEIKRAMSSVNRQLNNIRQMRDSFTQETLSFGKDRYSIADLVGAGKPNKTIKEFIGEGVQFTSDRMKKVQDAFANKTTEQEKVAIGRKYGLTPQNYYMVKTFEEQTRSAIGRIAAQASDISDEARAEALKEAYGPAFKLLMEGQTPAQIQQAVGMMMQEFGKNLNALQTNMIEIGNMFAMKYSKDEQEKQAQTEQRQKQTTNRSAGLSPFFVCPGRGLP